MMEWVKQLVFSFQGKEDFQNNDNHNEVVKFHEYLRKVGMTEFGFVGLEKALEEYLDMLHIVACWGFALSHGKVGSIGTAPYYG